MRFCAQALEGTETKLLGYCWTPNAIHLALAVKATPLAEVLRRLIRYRSQRIRGCAGAKARYMNSLAIRLPEPEILLPMLLRYIHCIPVIAGAALTPEEYTYTSHGMCTLDLRLSNADFCSLTQLRQLH